MSEIIVSEQRKKAVELNQKIIVSAELAQKNLWDMCISLKSMRDDKLYKELGYSNFENYCENAVGIKRRQAYKYISISEKVSSNFVHSSGQIGVQKLSLLATISEQEQQKVAERVDLKDTTVKELKAEIDRLKEDKNRKQQELSKAMYECDDLRYQNAKLKNEKSRLESEMNTEKNKNSELNAKVVELENRPIEVAVQEDKEAKELVKQLGKQLSEADQKYTNDLEIQRKKYQQLINNEQEKSEKLQKQLEELQSTSQETVVDTKAIFKAYYSNAIGAFNSMLDFINTAKDNKDFFVTKTKQLIDVFSQKLGGQNNERISKN